MLISLTCSIPMGSNWTERGRTLCPLDDQAEIDSLGPCHQPQGGEDEVVAQEQG